jgi:hypothetical protein
MKDLYYQGVKLNKKPLTQKEAENEVGLIVINYGYRPEIVDHVGEKKYKIHFGYNGDEGYVTAESKPITATSEQEACIKLKDQFESYEGVACEIFSVTEFAG